MTDTALQTINFNFYGDDLIALRDNATGEIYIAINSALKGIVFANRQAKHIHNKWTDDLVISKVGIQNFVLHSNGGMQDTLCISLRKISLALAKINIIPNMRKTQPELTSKLELYQDKCADVLASIFIDKKSTDQNTQSLIDSFNTFTQTINDTLLSMNERIMNLEKTQAELEKLPKKFSYWLSKMFPKYQLLMEHFGIQKNGDLYRQLYWEFENIYPDISINQIIDDFCYENKIDICFTLDAIEHDKTAISLFEALVDSLLTKYNLLSSDPAIRSKTIFDDGITTSKENI